jgi:Cu-Zn family superoxide dismutase
MTRSMQLLLSAAVCTLIIVAACDDRPHAQSHAHNDHDHDHDAHVEAWRAVTHAVAVLRPTEDNSAEGVLHFVAVDGGVRVHGEVRGLNANQQHAMHIHEWGDLRAADGMATGGHYNPEGHPHGLPNDDERHAGDFGNLQADDQGVAHFDMTVDNITIAGLHNPIIGRGLIVHAEPDDGSQPVGAAGGRIAQAVIGVANAEWSE